MAILTRHKKFLIRKQWNRGESECWSLLIHITLIRLSQINLIPLTFMWIHTLAKNFSDLQFSRCVPNSASIGLQKSSMPNLIGSSQTWHTHLMIQSVIRMNSIIQWISKAHFSSNRRLIKIRQCTYTYKCKLKIRYIKKCLPLLGCSR